MSPFSKIHIIPSTFYTFLPSFLNVISTYLHQRHSNSHIHYEKHIEIPVIIYP